MNHALPMFSRSLIESNRQRVKTVSQIAAEGMELQRVETERAALRRKATQNNEAAKSVHLEPKEQEGESLDAVAASLGISRDRWFKLKTIFTKAQQGDAEAEELMKAVPSSRFGSPKLDSPRRLKVEQCGVDLPPRFEKQSTTRGESGLRKIAQSS